MSSTSKMTVPKRNALLFGAVFSHSPRCGFTFHFLPARLAEALSVRRWYERLPARCALLPAFRGLCGWRCSVKGWGRLAYLSPYKAVQFLVQRQHIQQEMVTYNAAVLDGVLIANNLARGLICPAMDEYQIRVVASSADTIGTLPLSLSGAASFQFIIGHKLNPPILLFCGLLPAVL